MSTDTAQQNGASPQALERQVQRNREELARTVDALHRKLDVKTQARERVSRLRSSATTGSGRPRPELLGAAGAAMAAVAVLFWLRRR